MRNANSFQQHMNRTKTSVISLPNSKYKNNNNNSKKITVTAISNFVTTVCFNDERRFKLTGAKD